MTRSFTICPGDFGAAARLIERTASHDPAIFVRKEGSDTCIYFGGDVDVLRAAVGGRGIACMRILPGPSVIHVDAEGYEASVQQLRRFFAGLVLAIKPFSLYDDESGDDLTWNAQRFPSRLFAAEPEFE